MAAQRPSLYSKAKGVCVVWGAKVSSRALPENTLVVLALPRQKQLRAKTKPRPEISTQGPTRAGAKKLPLRSMAGPPGPKRLPALPFPIHPWGRISYCLAFQDSDEGGPWQRPPATPPGHALFNKVLASELSHCLV